MCIWILKSVDSLGNYCFHFFSRVRWMAKGCNDKHTNKKRIRRWHVTCGMCISVDSQHHFVMCAFHYQIENEWERLPTIMYNIVRYMVWLYLHIDVWFNYMNIAWCFIIYFFLVFVCVFIGIWGVYVLIPPPSSSPPHLSNSIISSFRCVFPSTCLNLCILIVYLRSMYEL